MIGVRHLAIVACLALLSLDLIAAETVVVRKKDGSRIEGKVLREDPAWVEIQTRFGRLKIFRTEILKIEEGVTLETQLKRRRSEVRDSDANALIRLGRWCEKQRLVREAMDLYREATAVAGPHYLETSFRVASLAMRLGEYRIAVERYLDLADRLKQEKAWQALKHAEDKLRTERMAAWKRANEELAGRRYQRAIIGYCHALYSTVYDEPKLEGDVGRNLIKRRILETRLAYFAELRKHVKPGTLLETDPGGITWHFTSRPPNLRSRSWGTNIHNLRLEVERYVSRWVALRGTFQGLSEWDSELAKAIKLDGAGHPDIAVAAYLPPAKTVHQNMLGRRAKGSAYLEELISSYPYDAMPAAMGLLAPGREVVCYGRLRKREQRVPQFVLEIWAVESVGDPQALQLAEFLKQPLSCEFDGTPLEAVLSHIEMLSQAKVVFGTGKTPEVPITLTIANQPTGAALSRIAKELGLQWTRQGTHVLMKKSLTDKEKLLQQQVMRLATDTARK